MDFLDDIGGFISDPLGALGGFGSSFLGPMGLLFGLGGGGLLGKLFGGQKMPDLPTMPNPPSASDAAAKAAKALARKRVASQQGMEDTALTGSLGIAPGLKPTLG